MSRSTAVLVSAVITGFLMVIAAAVAVGVPGAGASEENSSVEQARAETIAARQVLAAGDEQSATQFSAEAIPAASLPTPTVIPAVPTQVIPRPEESDVFLDLEWEMLLAQDRIAELTALNEALQDREAIYRERMDEANGAIQEIARSWSQPASSNPGSNEQVVASAPSDPPSTDPGDSPSPTPAPQPTPAPESTPVPTPVPTVEPLTVEVLPGDELTGQVGEVAALVGTNVWTSRQVYTKAAVVDWGDGTPLQSVVVIQDTGEVFAFHVYREAGIFVIYVTANVDGVKAENWTTINIDEPLPVATPEPTVTPEPTPAPASTPTQSVPSGPNLSPVAQPTGVTFDDAAYIGRAISGELWIDKISIKTEDGKKMFEVVLGEAKVFIDTGTGVILFGEHILSSPVSPVPEPPAAMLNFDNAYSIAVNAHPGTVSRIRQTSSTYTVTVSGVQIVVDAYTGQIR